MGCYCSKTNDKSTKNENELFDKDLELKAEIESMIEAGVLRKIGNQVIYIDEVLGEDMKDTIVYLKNKKNSGTLTILRAKLKEATI